MWTRRAALLSPAALCGAAQARELLTLATLEWPPYTGAELPQQGASSAVVRAALLTEGLGLNLSFMPWARAVAAGSGEARFAGYFPAYESEDRNRDSLRSARIGSSRVGFAYRRGELLRWNGLEDLGGQPIGVVRGYVNTKEFDQRMGDGRLRTDPAVSDEVNLRKLGAGRVRMVVVDQAVFHSLLGGPLAALRGQLVFDDSHLLEDKPLYVYFQRHESGLRWRRLFDRGLSRIDAGALFQRALAGSA